MSTSRLRLFKDANCIRKRIQSIGQALTNTHRDCKPLIIGILGGAFMFMADLVRTLDIHRCEVEFWRFASYGAGTRSSGQVRELSPLVANVAGRHIIVVEDIIDSGRTMQHVRERLMRLGAASVTVVALLQVRTSTVQVDHVGFRCGPQYVVGYGLDLDGRYRNLPALHYLDSA